MTATKDQFFKPGRVSATDKLATTDKAAREIIAEEARRFDTKTERLRRLRTDGSVLEREGSSGRPDGGDAATSPKATAAGLIPLRDEGEGP